MMIRYSSTLVLDSPWTRLSPRFRKNLIASFWWVTEILLLAGYADVRIWYALLAFTGFHAVVFLGLVGGRPMAFPAQLRIAYTAWLALGIFVPPLRWMMWVTTVGLTANLICGYCPLSRLLYLLPWNRKHGLNLHIMWRTFVTSPMPGRFQLR